MKKKNEDFILYVLIILAAVIVAYTASSLYFGTTLFGSPTSNAPANMTPLDAGLAKRFILGSAHIHADFKVYINGTPLDFSDDKYYDGSRFIHLDEDQDKYRASSVLHMHAAGVPLQAFFESIKLELPSSTKLYVNGKLNSEGTDYVFKDHDKLLLTDSYNEAAVQKQIASITDFANAHS